ncbi:MAG: PilZ domain-containing protein [Brevinematia bacterium]
MDQTSEFLRGISGGMKRGGGNSLDFLLFLAIVGLIILLIWLINEYYKRYVKDKKIGILKTISMVAPDLLKKSTSLNAYQRKILSDIIVEFKKKEVIAEGIPNSIFEKFAEYLYYNVHRLKVSEKEVKLFLKATYPIMKGYSVEMDLQKEGVLNLISTKVIGVNDKYVEVEYPAGVEFKFLRGMPLYINYNVGKHFLRGLTTIVSVKDNFSIILKKPENLLLSYERRYSRIPLQNTKGTLYNPKSNTSYEVEIIDISFEGVRLALQNNLQKNLIYHLSFNYSINNRDFIFTNLECSVSKSFITTKGRKEYGLFFLYLNNQTRIKLSTLIKEIALQMNMKTR